MTNKKIVISGSSKLQKEIKFWINHFEDKNYEILDYPKQIGLDNYYQDLANIYREFYNNLEKTDTYFLMNEDKNGIKGYIGASSISELTYVVMLNLIHNKKIDIYILNIPSKEVNSYDEIKAWLDMGWIKLYDRGE